MNFWQKFFWRLKFLALESWNKDRDVILLSISSAEKRGVSGEGCGLILTKFLQKKGIIKLNEGNNCFQYKQFTFFYGEQESLDYIGGDLISIWSNDDSFFQRNFLNNSVYKDNLEGPYEISEVRLQPGDFVIDAGANIGLFSILASHKVGPKGQIFSFEPIKETEIILKRNISYNKIDNVKIVPKALGDSNKKLEFVKVDNLAGSSGFIKGDFPKEEVEVVILDEFVKTNMINKVDFIKADIEGMERNLLKGAEMTIEKFKPKISICIYHRPDDPEVLESMISRFVPEYRFIKTSNKLYAYIQPKGRLW